MEDGGYGGGSTAKHDKSNLKLISFFFGGDKFAYYARSNAVTDLIHNIIITFFSFFFSLPIKREIILPNSRNGFHEIISVFFFFILVVAHHSLGLRTVTLSKRRRRKDGGNKRTHLMAWRDSISFHSWFHVFSSSIYELFLTIRMKHINQEAQRLLSRVSCNIEI